MSSQLSQFAKPKVWIIVPQSGDQPDGIDVNAISGDLAGFKVDAAAPGKDWYLDELDSFSYGVDAAYSSVNGQWAFLGSTPHGAKVTGSVSFNLRNSSMDGVGDNLPMTLQATHVSGALIQIKVQFNKAMSPITMKAYVTKVDINCNAGATATVSFSFEGAAQSLATA